MAQKKKVTARVVSQTCLAPGIYDLRLKTELAGAARCGQFVAVYPKDKSTLLPRPISVCETDPQAGILRLVYRVAGKGTAEFSGLQAGDSVDILGVLGNGFPVEKSLPGMRALLLGGGIGVPPILELAKELNCARDIVAGYRDSRCFLKEDFERALGGGAGADGVSCGGAGMDGVSCGGSGTDGTSCGSAGADGASAAPAGQVYIATEDGSVGTKGNVMDAIRENGLEPDILFACGPMPMLRAVKQYAQEKGVPAYLSLEERMACGVGACLGCVCRTTEVDAHSHVHNARICTDGPVFEAGEVDI